MIDWWGIVLERAKGCGQVWLAWSRWLLFLSSTVSCALSGFFLPLWRRCKLFGSSLNHPWNLVVWAMWGGAFMGWGCLFSCGWMTGWAMWLDGGFSNQGGDLISFCEFLQPQVKKCVLGQSFWKGGWNLKSSRLLTMVTNVSFICRKKMGTIIDLFLCLCMFPFITKRMGVCMCRWDKQRDRLQTRLTSSSRT